MNQQSLTQAQLFHHIFKDKVFVYSTRVIIAVFFFTAAFLLYKWSYLPPVVPLFYSLPWGEEQLVSPWGLWGLWLGLVFLNLINFLLGCWLFRNYKYLSYLLWLSSVVLTFLGIYTILKIIILIT